MRLPFVHLPIPPPWFRQQAIIEQGGGLEPHALPYPDLPISRCTANLLSFGDAQAPLERRRRATSVLEVGSRKDQSRAAAEHGKNPGLPGTTRRCG
jgi:hypothetical protein